MDVIKFLKCSRVSSIVSKKYFTSIAFVELKANTLNGFCSEREDAAEPVQVSGISYCFGAHVLAHSQAGRISYGDKPGPICEASSEHLNVRKNMYGRRNTLPTIFRQSIRIVGVAIGLIDPNPEIVGVRRRCECSPDVGHQCRAVESTERKITAINRRLYEFAAKQECRITDVRR